MKLRNVIAILLISLNFLSLSAFSQKQSMNPELKKSFDSQIIQREGGEVKFGKETTLVFGKSSVKIKTTLRSVADIVVADDEAGAKLKSYLVTYKTDRQGRYAQYTFTFSNDDYTYVEGLLIKKIQPLTGGPVITKNGTMVF